MTRQLSGNDDPSMTEPDSASGAPQIVAAKVGVIARVTALVAGLLLLLGGTIVSLGTVVLAPLGMAAAGYVQRRRKNPMTRGEHWIAASASIAVALMIALGALLAVAPPGTVRNAMQAADSASVASAKEPPPAWLERFGPGLGVRQPSPGSSRMLTILGGLLGVSFTVGLFSALFGTLGWGAGMLLGLAINGRWPGIESSLEQAGATRDDTLRVSA